MTEDLDGVVAQLAQAVRGAIGAVLCDFEGETVLASLGDTPAPPRAVASAAEHIPRAIELSMPVGEFLIRLAGAEPCALLRMFAELGAKHGAGGLHGFELRYDEVEMLVHRLPDEFYLVVVLRRPALTGPARRHLRRAASAVAPLLL